MSYTIPENLLQEINKLYNKNEEDLKQDVEIIKNWLGTQPHLPEIMDDKKILNFLLLNKFSIEKCKKKIDMYYSIRGIIPDMFMNPKKEELQEFLENSICAPHPKLYKNLYKIYMSDLKKSNTFSPYLLGVHIVNIFEVSLSEDFTFGEVIMVDFKNYTLSDLAKCTLTSIAKIFKFYKEVYSLRIQKLCIFNCPSYVTSLIGILRTVLPPKIFARCEFHKDDAILKEIFSEEDLPKDYGGNGPSLNQLNELLKENFLKYEKRFDYLDSMKTDESRRPEPLKNDEILGFHGNFKKLNVD